MGSEDVEEILTTFNRGDQVIRYSSSQDTILVVGDVGTGKTELSHFLALNNINMISIADGSGNYTIKDNNKVICDSKIDPCMAVPELIIDKTANNAAYYDFPGFSNTRSVSLDIGTAYFIQKVVRRMKSAKIIFTMRYDSVRKGEDRRAFVDLAKNISLMFRNIGKFEKSACLVVTNVDNTVEEGKKLVADDAIIQNIVRFLKDAKEDLKDKMKSSLPPEEEKLYGNAVTLIDIFTNDKEAKAPKIGIFRRPNQEGPLNEMKEMQRGKTAIQKMIYQQLEYTLCDQKDFGNTISDESKLKLNSLKQGIVEKIKQEISMIGQQLAENYSNQERQSEAIDDLMDKFREGYNELLNLMTDDEYDPQDFTKKMITAINKLQVEISSESINNMNTFSGYLEFAESLTSHSISPPVEWGENLKDIKDYLNDSQEWYQLLIQLRDTLTQYPIQKKVGLYDEIRKKLEFEIDSHNNEGVRNSLKQLLSMVQDDSGIKGEIPPILNETKLKFLKDLMLSFAQSTSDCSGNTLVVKGNVIKVGDVVNLPCFNQTQIVELFGLSKVFFDVNVNKKGGLFRIFSPELVVVNKQTLVLDGKDSDDAPPKQSELGKPGVPGKPGGSAGALFVIGQQCTNCDKLSISAVGGKGGRGQDGGNGVPGRDGDRAPYFCDAKHWQPQCGTPIFGHGFGWQSKTWLCKTYGNRGENGGTGGDGGRGGEGGLAGQVSLAFSGDHKGPIIKISQGPVGAGGAGGEGGRGGRQGDTFHIYPYIGRSPFYGWQYHCGKYSYEASNNYSPNGHYGIGNNYNESIQHPNSISFDPSQSISKYKNFLRENMGNAMNNDVLKTFLEYIEVDKNINSNYNTNDFMDDLSVMESQTHPMHLNRVHSYQNFLRRITTYAQDIRTKGITDENKLVLGYLYTSILSTIYRIQESSNTELVIDIKGYLQSVKEDIKQLEDFKNTMEKNQSKSNYQQMISDNINEANKLINHAILPEIENTIQQLRSNMQSLLDETVALEEDAEDNEVKLRNYKDKLESKMVLSTMFSIFQGIGQVVGFLGPVGAVIGTTIGLATTVAQDLSTNASGSSEGPDPISNLPDGVSKCLDAFKEMFKKKQLAYLNQLSQADEMLNELKDVTAIAALKKKIEQTRTELEEVTRKAAAGDQAAIQKSYTSKTDFNASMKETLEELVKQKETASSEKSKMDKCINTVSKIQNVVKMADVGLDIYKQVTKAKSSIKTVEEALEQNEQHIAKLKEYEQTIYSTILPMAEAIKDKVNNAVKSSAGQSRAALDVSSWNVQSAIRNIKVQLKDMTSGFKMQGKIVNTVNNLIYGMTTMIQVYDNIQDYYERAQLADYISDITSNRANSIRIHVSDSSLQSAIDKLAFRMQNNFVMSEYEKTMSAVRQYVFPFGNSTEEFTSPIEYQVSNMSLTVSEVVNNIGIVFDRLRKYVTVIQSDDENIFPKQVFNSEDNRHPPFYIWKYSSIENQARRLFQGNEVLLNADISRGIQENAIKFDRVGFRFKAKCSRIQTELDEALDGFSIKMTHLGNSYYRCGSRIFRMTHGDIGIQHSVNRQKGKYFNQNEVYEKITSNDPLLSPYGMWKVQLIGDDFSKLENFIGHTIDVELEGRGSYLNHKEDENICTDDLKRYYEEVTDPTIYIDDQSGVVDPADLEECENEDTPPHNKTESVGGFEFMNPIKSMANLLTFGKPFMAQTLTNISPTSEIGTNPLLRGEGGSEQSSNSIQPANYNLLDVNGTLLLMDTVIRRMTRNSATRIKTHSKDDEYAQRLAYNAHAP